MTSISTILVIDDHEFSRKGLILALKEFPDVKVIGEVSSGSECLEIIQKTHIDIILMSIRMSGMNGIETAKKVIQKKPETKVIAMIDFIEDENIKNVIDAELFSGVLLKNIGSAELKHALHNVINGKIFYSPELIGVLSAGKRLGKPSIHLTKRETEILQLVAKGLTNQKIADKLNVSIRTITNHRANMHKKIGVSNTIHLISWGIKNNILSGI